VDEAVVESAQRRVAAGDIVLLVAHFPHAFTRILDAVTDCALSCEVLTSRVRPHDLIHRHADLNGHATMVATLACMLDPQRQPMMARRPGARISVVSVDRYPVAAPDRRLEQFLRSGDWSAYLGYFLAMEDDVLSRAVGPKTSDLLRILGLGDDDLFSSHLVNRRLERAIRRWTAQVPHERPAESAHDWFAFNLPQP
jgi:hypothetical protein